MRVEVARSRTDKNPLVFEFDFGETIHEAASKFDSDGPYGKVVMHLFIQAAKAQMRQAVLDYVEGRRVRGEPAPTQQQLQEFVNDWRPTIKHHGKRPLDKALAAMEGLNEEEREAFRRALTSA